MTAHIIANNYVDRGDGVKYYYAGPTPSVSVVAVVESYVCQLNGFLEFTALSNPANVYTTLSMSGSVRANWTEYTDATHAHIFLTGYNEVAGNGWAGSFDSKASYTAAPDITVITVTGSSSSSVAESYFFQNDVSTRGAILKSTYVRPPNYASGVDPGTLGGSNDPGIGLLIEGSGGAPSTLNITGNSSATVDVDSGTYDTSSTVHWVIIGGSIGLDLGDLDTETAALARAIGDGPDGGGTPSGDSTDDFGFGDGLYTVQETRQGVGATAFKYQTGTYQLAFLNLIKDMHFMGTVQFERRTAAGDGSGDTSSYADDWEDADTQDFSFTADNTFYSASGFTMPQADGYQYRIKYVAFSPEGQWS